MKMVVLRTSIALGFKFESCGFPLLLIHYLFFFVRTPLAQVSAQTPLSLSQVGHCVEQGPTEGVSGRKEKVVCS